MPTSNRVKQRRFPENSEPTAWVLEKEGFRPKGHTPGLVSRVFSLEGFFSLTCLGRSPDILGSPTRRMWGQCWSVLIKKGFVTPRTTFGLERGEKRERAVSFLDDLCSVA